MVRYTHILGMHEPSRKIVHMFFGIGIAALAYTLQKELVVLLLAASIFVGFILAEGVQRGYRIPLVSDIIHTLERDGEYPGKGAFYFTASALFCVLFFDAAVFVPAILSLSVLDGAATLVGLRWGRHRITNGKSLEGSAGGVLVNTLVLALLLPPLPAIAASVVGGVVELVSPVDDNLTIPVCICILLTLMGV
jgi:dolichol kinase